MKTFILWYLCVLLLLGSFGLLIAHTMLIVGAFKAGEVWVGTGLLLLWPIWLAIGLTLRNG